MPAEMKDKDAVEEITGGTDNAADGMNNEGAAQETGANSAGNADAKAKEQKTFTQEQVNRMMTREKNQGRNAALRDLGIDPKDTKMISLLQSVLKGNSESADGTAESDEHIKELERRTLVAEAKAEAMQQGAQLTFVDDIVTLALGKMEDGSDISTVIGEVKTKYPVWFEKPDGNEDNKKSSATANKRIGEKGTGASVKGKSGTDSKDKENIGARLAAQRKSQNSHKKSFWG